MTIEAGEKVRAVTDLPYRGGQAPEDKICRGELVTVERDEDGQLYFKEHADRYGGWPASEFIPDGMYQCPNCENPNSEVYSARSVKLVWVDGSWVESDVYSDGMSCASCHEEIDDEVLSVFGLEQRDKVFYSLCENDILEVAESLEVELTPDEMTRARDVVSDGMSSDWWDVTEIAIDTIKDERRETDGSAEEKLGESKEDGDRRQSGEQD